MTIRQILEAVSVNDIEKHFGKVEKSRSERIRDLWLKKGTLDIDKRGLIALTINKNEKLNDTRFNAILAALKRLDGKTIQSINVKDITFDKLKKIYTENKKGPKKEEEPLTKIKSRDMGKEVLFFPNTYEQLKAFSNWMAGKDPEVSVNHWCVASSNSSAFKQYAEEGGKFMVIVAKENGKPDWEQRYLFYSKPIKDENYSYGQTELADRENEHLYGWDNGGTFSPATTKFMKGFFIHAVKREEKNIMVPDERKEERQERKWAKKLFQDGILTLDESKVNVMAVRSVFKHLKENGVEHLKEVHISNSPPLSRLFNYTGTVKSIDLFTFENNTRDFKLVSIFNSLRKVGKVILKEGSYHSIPNLFQYLKGLESVDEIVLPDKAGRHVGALFESCSSLQKAPKMDLSNAISLNDTFHRCNSLTSLPSYVVSKVSDITGNTFNTYSLKKLDMSNPNAWTFSAMPKGFKFFYFKYSPLDEATRKELKKRNPHLEFEFRGGF